MSCGAGPRHGSEPALLWFWCRLTATTPIRPLAWEPPYAAGVALEKTKKKKKNHVYAVYTRPTSDLRTHGDLQRGWGKAFHVNGNQKEAGVAIFTIRQHRL